MLKEPASNARNLSPDVAVSRNFRQHAEDVEKVLGYKLILFGLDFECRASHKPTARIIGIALAVVVLRVSLGDPPVAKHEAEQPRLARSKYRISTLRSHG